LVGCPFSVLLPGCWAAKDNKSAIDATTALAVWEVKRKDLEPVNQPLLTVPPGKGVLVHIHENIPIF
jgi:hypothetical protein